MWYTGAVGNSLSIIRIARRKACAIVCDVGAVGAVDFLP